MKFWQIIVATLLAILLVSFLAGAGWRSLFNAELPAYLGGLAGGITGAVVWSFLQKHRQGRKRAARDQSADE